MRFYAFVITIKELQKIKKEVTINKLWQLLFLDKIVHSVFKWDSARRKEEADKPRSFFFLSALTVLKIL